MHKNIQPPIQGVSKYRALFWTGKKYCFPTVWSITPFKLKTNVYTLIVNNISSLYVLLCFLMTLFRRRGVEWANSDLLRFPGGTFLHACRTRFFSSHIVSRTYQYFRGPQNWMLRSYISFLWKWRQFTKTGLLHYYSNTKKGKTKEARVAVVLHILARK